MLQGWIVASGSDEARAGSALWSGELSGGKARASQANRSRWSSRSFSVVEGFNFPGEALGYTGKVGTTTTAGKSLD